MDGRERRTWAAAITEIAYRAADTHDGQGMYRLAQASRALDPNSPYAYLMACLNFGDTCVVATAEGELIGFVLALRPQTRPEAVFVWQIGVNEDHRGQGIGGRLLDELIHLPSCDDVGFLEATVTPSNDPSDGLFRSFARRHGAEVHEEKCFTSGMFPEETPHEDEILLRIGTLSTRKRS